MKEKCNRCKDITDTQLIYKEPREVLDYISDTYYQANCSERKLVCLPRENLEKLIVKDPK